MRAFVTAALILGSFAVPSPASAAFFPRLRLRAPKAPVAAPAPQKACVDALSARIAVDEFIAREGGSDWPSEVLDEFKAFHAGDRTLDELLASHTGDGYRAQGGESNTTRLMALVAESAKQGFVARAEYERGGADTRATPRSFKTLLAGTKATASDARFEFLRTHLPSFHVFTVTEFAKLAATLSDDEQKDFVGVFARTMVRPGVRRKGENERRALSHLGVLARNSMKEQLPELQGVVDLASEDFDLRRIMWNFGKFVGGLGAIGVAPILSVIGFFSYFHHDSTPVELAAAVDDMRTPAQRLVIANARANDPTLEVEAYAFGWAGPSIENLATLESTASSNPLGVLPQNLLSSLSNRPRIFGSMDDDDFRTTVFESMQTYLSRNQASYLNLDTERGGRIAVAPLTAAQIMSMAKLFKVRPDLQRSTVLTALLPEDVDFENQVLGMNPLSPALSGPEAMRIWSWANALEPAPGEPMPEMLPLSMVARAYASNATEMLLFLETACREDRRSIETIETYFVTMVGTHGIARETYDHLSRMGYLVGYDPDGSLRLHR